VLPFENFTSEPTLTLAVNTAVRDAVEGRLGLRAAGERQADALVRGSITRYESDVPIAFSAAPTRPGQQQQAEVTKRMVQLTVTVEILDQRTGAILWSKSGMTLDGDYSPPQELDGRRKALDHLADNIVEGAQSQW